MIAMTTSNSMSVKARRRGIRPGSRRQVLPAAGRQTTAAIRLQLIRGFYHMRHFKQEKIELGMAEDISDYHSQFFARCGSLFFNHETKPVATMGSLLSAGLFCPGVWHHGFGGKSLEEPR